MNFIFGNTVNYRTSFYLIQFVTEDNETAKKIINNPIRKFRAVTIEGDKYDPSGTLEGGFNKQASLLIQIFKIKE